MRPRAFVEFWGVSLYPAVDGGMVHLQAPFPHQFRWSCSADVTRQPSLKTGSPPNQPELTERRDESEKFLARLAPLAKTASHHRGRHRARSAYPACTHAEMFALEHYRYIVASDDATDLVGDLLAELLLKLEPVRELVRNAGELGQAEHVPLRNVANRDITPKWEEVVFADRPHAYARDTYHLIGRGGCKTGLGFAWRIVNKFAPPVRESARCLLEAFAIWILTDGLEQITRNSYQSCLIDASFQYYLSPSPVLRTVY